MAISRNIFWIAFFASILASWWWLYSMSLSMNMDLLGRMSMSHSISSMDMSKEPLSDMNMAKEPLSDINMAKEPMSDMNMAKEPMSDMNMSKEPTSKMNMSTEMGSMRQMDGKMSMDNSMPHFLPLVGMWAVMMAAMMLPTMVPTLRSYEDLMVSANGTRVGWLGVLLGYSIVWILFAVIISVTQIGLLYLDVVDMMGKAKSLWLSAVLLITAGAFQFTRA